MAAKILKPAQRAFTFVEICIVITILAAMTALVATRSGAYDHWKEETALKEFRDLLFFLHYQAIIDQSFYKVEIDFQKNAYRIGLLKPESQVNNSTSVISSAGVGILTTELNDFMNPLLGDEQTLIPPPTYPSLINPVILPGNLRFERIKTNRALWSSSDEEIAEIMISPKGYSEFSVLHMRMGNDQVVTLFVNPYTGYVNLYREYRDFEWGDGQINF